MRLKSNTAAWIGTLAILCSFAIPGVLRAGDISYSNLRINEPSLVFASNNDAVITGQSIVGSLGTYTLSGEFCLTGSCTGDTVSSALLRLTNLSLSCSSSSNGICDPIDISFQADGTTVANAGALDTWLSNATFSGPAPSGGSVTICIADSTHICSANASGSQSSTFSFGSELAGDVTYSFPVSGSFTLVGDLHFNGLPNGTTVTIPHSLDIAEIIPEPGGILLPATGLAVLFLMLRRRRPA